MFTSSASDMGGLGISAMHVLVQEEHFLWVSMDAGQKNIERGGLT